MRYAIDEGRRRRCRPANARGARVSRVVALTGFLAGLAAAPASADPHGAAHGLYHGPPEAWIGLAVAFVIALGVAEGVRRRRDTAIVALALLVGLLGAESAFHSVHHSDPEAAASCAIFTASQHVTDACADMPDPGPPTLTVECPPPDVVEPARPLAPFSSHEGRAPPARPSA